MSEILDKKVFGNCTLYLGDSYKILQEIQDKSIDLIHTDPPYEMPGLNSDGMGKFGSAIYKKSIDKLKDIELTKGFDLRALSDFERVCKNINFQIWCNKRQDFQYLSYAQEHLWNWQDIKLYRVNALPTVSGKYQDSEYCFHFWKGRALTGKYENKKPWYQYIIGGKKEWEHPALKPLEPILNLLETGSNQNDVVLDPFMGSGTTGVACIRKNRKFIGIELQPKYFKMACKRIGEEVEKDKHKLFSTNLLKKS